MTPVQMFRDRWECGHIGTVIFAVQAVLLVPYIIIAVIGGGTTLRTVSDGLVPFWLGGAIVSLVVMGYVFFGGMRGTAWVNAFQTILFLLFGAIAVSVVSAGMGGFQAAMETMLASPSAPAADPRARVAAVLLQLHVHPAVVDRLPAHRHLLPDGEAAVALQEDHRALPDLHAGDLAAVGVPRRRRQPGHRRARDPDQARGAGDAGRGGARPAARRTGGSCARQAAGDDVILRLVEGYAPLWLAALLGAAVMAAVMASDSQILALSTMFTEDVFAFYGGRRRFGEAVQVRTGRAFVIVLTLLAYVIALQVPQSIFDIATQYAFAGYAALAPLLVAALFWKGSTKWGALATTLWTAAAVAFVAVVQTTIPAPPPGAEIRRVESGRHAGHHASSRGYDGRRFPAGRADDPRLGARDGRRVARSRPVARPGRDDAGEVPSHNEALVTEPSRMTTVQWVIVGIAALGFAFDTYELLMLPLIVRPALAELLGVAPNSLEVNAWVGTMQYVPALCGGVFGLLGGYLTDLLGRRRVLIYSILLYGFSAFAAGLQHVGPRVPVLALLHVRRRLRGVRRRRRLAGRALRRPEAAREGHRLHAGLRLARRRDGRRRLLHLRHLRGVVPGDSAAAMRPGATR